MLKSFDIWGPTFIFRKVKNLLKRRGEHVTKHVIFCVADHFEPNWQNPGFKVEEERVRRWIQEYAKLAAAHKDSDGRCPQHTWFYAAEQYKTDLVEALSGLCKQSLGEIEMHLHHDHDTPDGFRQKLEHAKRNFSRHGIFVTQTKPVRHAFGFIHGNFTLNNSGKGGRLCGVDNELRILRDAGCYADFTLSCGAQESQTRKVNSIYYARDIPGRRKSHNTGIDVRVGGKEVGDLMLIQGPLALDWRRRKWGILPRIENGCILGNNPGTRDRIDLWVQQDIHVHGRLGWIFIKVYCHGAQEDDIDSLLGEGAHRMYLYLEKEYNDGKRYFLHYVTAREMYNIAKAAEADNSGNPFFYRDYLIKPYLNSGKKDVAA
jgi:hypothetical protein